MIRMFTDIFPAYNLDQVYQLDFETFVVMLSHDRRKSELHERISAFESWMNSTNQPK